MPKFEKSGERFLTYSLVSKMILLLLLENIGSILLARESKTFGIDSSLCKTTELCSESIVVSQPYRFSVIGHTHSCFCLLIAGQRRHEHGPEYWCAI